MRLHILGIAGTFMAGLAMLAKLFWHRIVRRFKGDEPTLPE